MSEVTSPVARVDDSLAVVRTKVREWILASLSGSSTHSGVSWRDRFFTAGLATPGWPCEYGGLGLSPEAVTVVNEELTSAGAPVPFNLITVRMIGATLLTLGTSEQKLRYLRPLAEGLHTWVQLFSEPGAGSDLASLSCRAERVNGGWVINGQKVWSSYAHLAAYGLLLARTDPTQPKQKGITAFIVDMNSDGVLVRELRQMTGTSEFCEVFLDDVFVPDCDVIDGVNRGWNVARAMLASERASLGGRGASPVARVGGVNISSTFPLLSRIDLVTRHTAVDLYCRGSVIELLAQRLGHGMVDASLVKLAQTRHNMLVQEFALRAHGSNSIAYEPANAAQKELVWGFLRSRANTIGGGTSEVLRGIIGEVVLGLPREPDPFKDRPWSEIPRG